MGPKNREKAGHRGKAHIEIMYIYSLLYMQTIDAFIILYQVEIHEDPIF